MKENIYHVVANLTFSACQIRQMHEQPRLALTYLLDGDPQYLELMTQNRLTITAEAAAVLQT